MCMHDDLKTFSRNNYNIIELVNCNNKVGRLELEH